MTLPPAVLLVEAGAHLPAVLWAGVMLAPGALARWFQQDMAKEGERMRVAIRETGQWPGETVDLLRTRLEFALGRFAGRVRSVSVRLTDLNGPRGGIDKKCLVAVRLEKPPRVVVVEDVDVDAAVVVSRAAERTARAVARAIDSAGDWRALSRDRRP